MIEPKTKVRKSGRNQSVFHYQDLESGKTRLYHVDIIHNTKFLEYQKSKVSKHELDWIAEHGNFVEPIIIDPKDMEMLNMKMPPATIKVQDILELLGDRPIEVHP